MGGDEFGRRKSKNDKRKKRKIGVYKKGGKFRSTEIKETNKEEGNVKKKGKKAGRKSKK
jgi:hypothetical protein